MDLKKILSMNGVEADKIDTLVESIKSELHTEFVPKTQYNKKVNQIDTLQEKLNDLEAKAETPNEYKQKYDELNSEFELYKTNIETEKVNKSKLSLLKTKLKNDGIEKENLIDLLCKGIDLDSIEVENDDIKGWEELSKTYKENYSDFYTSTEITGGKEPTTPPTGGTPTKLTVEQIKAMTPQEINANWEAVSQTLAQQ